MIPFNRPLIIGNEISLIKDCISRGWISGRGHYTKEVEALLKCQLNCTGNILLTTSCTHSLELSAILLNLMPGDEVIVPSFTFVSSALAFYMHGANIVFSDIRKDTLNIDESNLENLITCTTKAIVVVHYAGVACEMDSISKISEKYGLTIIEDNAHGLYGKYKGASLGTIGHMATQSFHETKNYTCGEGGAIIINDSKYNNRAEIILEKGTDRSNFFRGSVDKYSWVDKGSSYVMSDILAAFLYGQIKKSKDIQKARENVWNYYYSELTDWSVKNNIQLPYIPGFCQQGYHMFYMLMPNLQIRDRFISYLKNNGIQAVFHYLPLHLSKMGIKISENSSICLVSENSSDRLVRLPFFNGIKTSELEYIVEKIINFQL